MHAKTAFRLGLGLALAGALLWMALGVGLPAQAIPDRQSPDQPETPSLEQNGLAEFFAPSPAADAMPPVSRAAALSPQLQSTAPPWMLPDPVWRIGVTQDGLYQLPYATLQAAGVPVTGAAVTAFRLWHRGAEVAIEISDSDGNGLFDPADALIFYGEKFHGTTQDEKYTDENVYWLSVESSAQGKRMISRSVAPTGDPATGICSATVTAEKNLRYFARWTDAPGTDTTWFWERMIAPTGQIVTTTFPITLANIHTNAYTASLLIEVAGRNYSAVVNPDHHLRLELNGAAIGEVFWDGEIGHIAVLDIPSALLQEGDNTLSIGVVGTVVAQDVYFDRAELTYLHAPVAEDGILRCTVPEAGTPTYSLAGLTPNARLYDVTDPLNPIRLTGHSAFTFRDTAAQGTRYLAMALPLQDEYTLTVGKVGEGNVTVTPDQVTYLYGDIVTLTATAATGWTFTGWSGDINSLNAVITHTITANTVVTATFLPPHQVFLPLLLKNSGGVMQNAPLLPTQPALAGAGLPTLTLTQYHPDVTLITPTAGADLLIIAPSEFHTALQPLIARRQTQGLQVALVAEQDIYPLFNGGVYHPQAIRAFVAHAAATWPAPAPKYLLLAGGGHFNFKGHAPETFGAPARIWIPPYLEFADPDQGEVPVDARYGDVDGNGLPELMVGRIPANSEAELSAYLTKLLAYDTLPTAPWMETMLLVADDGASSPELFAAALDRIKNNTFPAWAVTEKVYIQNYCPKPPASWSAPCPTATLALTQTWSQGAALLLYSGHGAPGVWANEPLLRGSQLATLQPMTGQPFIIALDCWDGFWMYPRGATLGGVREAISIGERATMGWPDRGAIAVFGPAGLAYLSIEEPMAQAITEQIFLHGERRLGELTQAGRLGIWGLPSSFGKYLARTYTLLGDPSMQLRVEDVGQLLR